MRQGGAVYFILAFVLFKGLFWAIVVPPFQSPDEQTHFAYVQYMAEQHRIPVVQKYQNGTSRELKAYEQAVGLWRVVDHPGVTYQLNKPAWSRTLYLGSLAHARQSSGSNSASGYPPGYYWPASLFYRLVYSSSIAWRFYFVRFFSVLTSLITVWAAYRVGSVLAPTVRLLPEALALMTALQPMYSQISSSINNDAALVAVTSLCIAWVVRHLRTGASSSRSLVFGGVLCGLSLLMKAEALYVIFAVLIGLLWSMRTSQSIRLEMLRVLAYFCVPIVVIYAPWAVFSLVHYHSVLGTMGFQQVYPGSGSFGTYFRSYLFSLAGLVYQFRIFVMQFWAYFGQLDTPFQQMWLYCVLGALMIFGAVVAAWDGLRLKAAGSVMHWSGSIVTYLLGFVIGNLVFLWLVEYDYFRTYHTTMLQGRYLFTSLIPLNALIVLGLNRVSPPRWRWLTNSAVIGLSVILNLAALYLLLKRFYWGGYA